MSSGAQKLFLYKDVYELVINTSNTYLVDNRPMNLRKLVVHKGLTNELTFSVRDRDRKLQNVFSNTVSANIIDPSTRQRLTIKTFEHTSDVGMMKLTLDEGDLRDMSAGLYTMYVQMIAPGGVESPLYIDQNNGIKFDLEVRDQVDATPVPTQSANSFLQIADTGNSDPANIFATTAFLGNQTRNFKNAQHSTAIYTTNYTGNITIQGSCIEQVPGNDDASTDWFDVTTIPLANVSGITHNTFQHNINWLRIMHTPDNESGSVDQVQVRN